MSLTAQSPYSYEQDRFSLSKPDCNLERQYANYYSVRLDSVYQILSEKALKTWKSLNAEITPVSELKFAVKSIIIGNIYKDVTLRPNILKEVAAKEMPEEKIYLKDRKNLLSPTDIMYLEDKTQRIAIKHKDVNRLVCGVPCAMLGAEFESDAGVFVVDDVLFVNPEPSSPILHNIDMEDYWVGFVSNLGFESLEHDISSELLVSQYLLGDWLHSCILKRLVIVGNSIHCRSVEDDTPRFISRKTLPFSIEPMDHFDHWLASLNIGSRKLSVDIMPGDDDCVTQYLPQQPIHSACFPKSISTHESSKSLKGVTNPYMFNVGSRKVLVSCGEGIKDVRRYSEISDPLDRMEALLNWGHLAPTCPDTLPGFPLNDKDPMLISSQDYPDVFVCGNVDEIEAPKYRFAEISTDSKKTQSGSFMVALPKFSTKKSVFLINLKNFETKEIVI